MTDLEFQESLKKIDNALSTPAKLEQTAEECIELAHALLKKSRKLRGENWTPATLYELNYKISEEYTDVMMCFKLLGLEIDELSKEAKTERWIQRLGL